MTLQGCCSDKCFDMLFREMNMREGNDINIFLLYKYFIIFIPDHFCGLKFFVYLLMQANLTVMRKPSYCNECAAEVYVICTWFFFPATAAFPPKSVLNGWDAAKCNSITRDCFKGKKTWLIEYLVQTQSGFTVSKITISTPTTVNLDGVLVLLVVGKMACEFWHPYQELEAASYRCS